ncbi:MAG: dihydroneopterin aldolase [Proteobacteria bacterium]|nr:MAG: dihydroneopterin aldolase [Pseudomonadota bacterium]
MKVLVEGLSFKCIIGLLDFERKRVQRVILDVGLVVKDDDFVDYAKVARLIKKTYKKEKFFKVEDSLLRVSEVLKKKFPQIQRIKIKIIKPDILSKCRVGAVYKKRY